MIKIKKPKSGESEKANGNSEKPEFLPQKTNKKIVIGIVVSIVVVAVFFTWNTLKRGQFSMNGSDVKITNTKTSGGEKKSSTTSSSSNNKVNNSMMTQDSSAPQSINQDTKKATDIVNKSLSDFFGALYSVSATSSSDEVKKAKNTMNKYAEASLTDKLLQGAGGSSTAKTKIVSQQSGGITAAVQNEDGGNVTLQVIVPFSSAGQSGSAWFNVVTNSDGSKIMSCDYKGTLQSAN